MKKTAAILLIAGLVWGLCGGRDRLRVGTFNIEDFPKSDRQAELAFEVIEELGYDALAVQEITDPRRFAREAARRLGGSFSFVYNRRGPRHRLGVLYNTDRLSLLSTRTYRETRVDGRGKPAFEVRLRIRDGEQVLRLITVHLKAGGEGVDIRRRQLRALRPVISRAWRSGERVVLLGDFNATSPADRGEIEALAAASRMTWASRDLECTCFWDRRDGCRGTPLDHVLTWQAPAGIAARGPCETEGCEPRDRCPAFHREVSDHCPITIDLR
jgi:endonuclease/exonuclease/phosphatase family metal-dependent hydrolase